MKLRFVHGAAVAAIAISLAATGAHAQDSPGDGAAKVAADDEVTADEILVKGVRLSVEEAIQDKKDATQIIEKVVAEDVGKFPDNNVAEAISRLTGVQIDRVHGEGSDVSIRGMSNVQTAVNGVNVSAGIGREMSLSDIPAELLKSVTVYKTRTADQIEGGGGGTVDVELRRPLDLKLDRWTLAGSARAKFSNNGGGTSPYYSALIGRRSSVGDGEFGFLINASRSVNRYFENYSMAEAPGTFFAEAYNNLPPSERDTLIAPFRANYGLEHGTTRRTSINGVVQWRPSDRIEFVAESTYFNDRNDNTWDKLYATVREWNSILSNYETVPLAGTQMITHTNFTGWNGTSPSAGTSSGYGNNYGRHWHNRLEAHYRGDRVNIDLAVGHDNSKSENYSIFYGMQPNGLRDVFVDFRGTGYEPGHPMIEFPGFDMTNPDNFRLGTFTDSFNRERSTEYWQDARVDFNVSDTGFLRRIEIGERFTSRDIWRGYAYRDAWLKTNLPVTDFPFSDTLHPIGPSGTDVRWLAPDTKLMYHNMDTIRKYIIDHPDVFGYGGSGIWESPYPEGEAGSTWDADETTFAVWGQLHYGFKLGSIPFSGVAGVRGVHTYGSSKSTNTYFDRNWNMTQKQETASGSYWEWNPSFNLRAEIGPRTTARFAWTRNIDRPSFWDTREARVVELNNHRVYSGNPDLAAQVTTGFDIAVDHSFGRSGFVSLGYYNKRQTNTFFYQCISGIDPADLGISDNQLWTECTIRNAGTGRYQGFEGRAHTFFDSLPGELQYFGIDVNGTLQTQYDLGYPAPDKPIGEPDVQDMTQAEGISKWTANATLLYDHKAWSGRLSYNWRSPYRAGYNIDVPQASVYSKSRSTLDAAINFTPVEFATISVEATNLLNNNNLVYFGNDYVTNAETRIRARTFQLSLRLRN